MRHIMERRDFVKLAGMGIAAGASAGAVAFWPKSAPPPQAGAGRVEEGADEGGHAARLIR